MQKSRYNAQDEKTLMTELWDPQIADNPEAFVMFAYPWGKEGSPLERYKKGPKVWQRDELQKVAQHIKDNKERMAMGLNPLVYKSATASGRGPGKSALLAWMTDWLLSCVVGSSAVITANTEPQLRTKTWGELGVWTTMLINAHWFEKQAQSLKPADWFANGVKEQLQVDTTYYGAQGILWSEDNPDAFAGNHSQRGMLLIYDESSGIHEAIWKVSEGFFTDLILHRYWFAFGNPRRNTGAFFDCFHKHREYWNRRQIDCRTVEDVDQNVYKEIIDKYGENSREAKIEVKGEFPDIGDNQFISREQVDGARLREVQYDRDAPLIMGVDPARFGDDTAVIRFRQGRDARSIPAQKFKGLDNMQLAMRCADAIERFHPDAVCIDAGNGTGTIDRLRELGYKVHEVWFGAASPDAEWGNMRTYLWNKMREWLGGGCIDVDEDLRGDLVGPEYGFLGKSDKIILEPKEKMKKRGIPSPDNADALACTFAVKPARHDAKTFNRKTEHRRAKNVDYNPFG